MSLCTVAELRSALGVGTLYPDATLQQSCDAADAVLIPMLWADTYFNTAHSNTSTQGTLYFDESVTEVFYVGQTVVITGNEAHNNGSKTITAVGEKSITFSITGTPTAKSKHPLMPYGVVTLSANIDWTADSAIQESALMIAVDIWQARQTTSSGGVSPDFQPSPWKMGNSLLAKVRGLIAHALDPRSMVG
jgi:hypothetical protein